MSSSLFNGECVRHSQGRHILNVQESIGRVPAESLITAVCATVRFDKGSFEMSPRELELLRGMRNCYSVCHANFEDTIEMVGGGRGLKPEEVRRILTQIKDKYSDDVEYKELRSQLPKEFPF